MAFFDPDRNPTHQPTKRKGDHAFSTARLEAGYEEMSRNRKREFEALEWAEVTVGDVSNELIDAD